MDKKEIESGLELAVQFDKEGTGLVPVIVQDNISKEVLMLAYANREALEKTLEVNPKYNKRLATFYSRSRKEIWTKGETSGDFLEIINILVDCDQDALIYKVQKVGSGACHTKGTDGKTRGSCFYREITDDGRLEFVKKIKGLFHHLFGYKN